MTLISTSNRVQHLTDGHNILWAVPFAFHEATELHVVLSDPDGSDAGTLVLDTDYVVSGGDGATGWVTFPAAGQAHPTGKMLTVIRILDVNQPTDVGGLSLTWADKVEREIDRSRMIDQQLQEQLDRCVMAPETGGEVPILTDLEAMSEAAQEAATDAAAARDAAQVAQAGAETAAADAATARDAAQSAQVGAEAARDQAVTAQGAAQAAQAGAEAAQSGAQAAQASAETARDQAQSYANQINTGQFSPVDHNHDGVYEPVDPHLVRDNVAANFTAGLTQTPVTLTDAAVPTGPASAAFTADLGNEFIWVLGAARSLPAGIIPTGKSACVKVVVSGSYALTIPTSDYTFIGDSDPATGTRRLWIWRDGLETKPHAWFDQD